MKNKETKARNERRKREALKIGGLECVYLPTAKFGDVWKFFTETAGGKAGETWDDGGGRSGHVTLAGVTVVVGSDEETDEDQELGIPVKHGLSTLYFGTPNLDALYHALANRGAAILRGPMKTHWGAKVMTVKAGDAVIAFVETKKRKRR